MEAPSAGKPLTQRGQRLINTRHSPLRLRDWSCIDGWRGQRPFESGFMMLLDVEERRRFDIDVLELGSTRMWP
jgi:hypothetical protein